MGSGEPLDEGSWMDRMFGRCVTGSGLLGAVWQFHFGVLSDTLWGVSRLEGGDGDTGNIRV